MNNYNNMNNLNFLKQIKIIVFCILFVGYAGSTQAMTNEKTASATAKNIDVHSIYIRGTDGAVFKRLYSRDGTVTIGHTAGLTSGSLDMCVGDNNAFGYSPTFTFTAGGGSWDTPHGLWVTSINKDRTKEKEKATYWQRFNDSGGGGRWGRIAWSAVKPVTWDGKTGYGSGKVYLSSSNSDVVSCAGMKCEAVSNGNATITAHFPSVTTRMWVWAHYSKPYKGTKVNGKIWKYDGSDDWISEHWDHPNSVNKRKPDWMFCPTVESPNDDNKNYCTNKLALPEKTVSWPVSVGAADRCSYCGDGKITSSEECDTTAGSTPVDSCVASYDSMCEYCVSPNKLNQCTWQTIVGPHCGDGIVNGTEQCDAGVNNGLACTAPYNGTCQYCSNMCTNAVANGPYCGDGIKNDAEECDGSDGVRSGRKCTSNCTISYVAECGTKNGLHTNTIPKDPNLCANSSVVSIFPYLLPTGRWYWQCNQLSKPASPELMDCHASTCLANDPIKRTSPVIISDNMKTTISLNCPGDNGNKLCCKIHNTTKGNDPEEIVCTGSSLEKEIVEGQNEFGADCWFDDGNGEDDDEPIVNKDFKVQTACIESQCTANGTCAKAPKIAGSRSQCKSTCNSNADCTSGRIIETRP